MKRIEDSSCSFPSYFWSTFRSPFSTCYIPFQSSGSQESNTSNRVQFGAKIRKIWLSEDNCIKQVRISHQPKQVRISHQPMQVRISHQPMRLWCEISSVLPTPHEIFSFVFFTLSEIFLSGRNIEFSLLSFSLFYFLFLGSQTTFEDVFPEDERLNL